MNRSAFLSIDMIQKIKKCIVDKEIENIPFTGNTLGDIESSYKDYLIPVTEIQNVKDEDEFIFIEDHADFIIRFKEIITRNLNNPDIEKMISAHNLDFFLTKNNCISANDIETVNWNKLFLEYHDNKELQNSARMIHLECLFTRFEAHFKGRYKEFECGFKSADSQNCILCTQNWYIM